MKQKAEAESGIVIETLVANGATDIRQAGSQIAPQKGGNCENQ
ncbi:MAG: hypothetical protein ABR962_05415 [Candidatus Bathyarchaeia archaeon]